MRAHTPRIHDAGGELVIVGNGSAEQASDFVSDHAITTPVFTDPSLAVYRAAGARRGGGGWRLLRHAARAMRRGFFQWRVLGDPAQHGGVFVIASGGAVAYRYVSELAGDHPDPDEIIAALERVAAEGA